MKGLTIPNNVGEEITLTTSAVIHFETMHAITYNRVKQMITTLFTLTGYGSKVDGIGELLPLPIQSGLSGVMNYLQEYHSVDFNQLQSVAALMDIKMQINQYGFFGYDTLTATPSWNSPGFDRNSAKITKKAHELLLKYPPKLHLTTKESQFREDLLTALENREPFSFIPTGQKNG